MANQKFQIFKRPDGEVMRAIGSIYQDLEVPLDAVNVDMIVGDKSIYSGPCSQLPKWVEQELSKSDNGVVAQKIIVRNPQNSIGMTIDRPPERSHDEVTLSLPEASTEHAKQTIFKFAAAAQRHLPAYGRRAATSELFGAEIEAFYAERDRLLSQLQTVAINAIEGNEHYRKRLDEAAVELEMTLKAKYEKKDEELENRFAARQKELDDVKAGLDKRAADLDDRAATHARRQIRKDLKGIYADRAKSFDLSRGTIEKRKPVHALFVSMLLLLGGLVAAAAFGFLPSIAGVPWWLAFLRLPLLLASFIAAVVFYIRWTDDWFRRHAEEELKLKQQEVDFDRASWLVEMALEWESEHEHPLPAQLMDRLSTGLFEAGSNPKVRHPGEDLGTALLSASSGLTMNLPGVGEVKLDRKGIDQFKKEVAAES